MANWKLTDNRNRKTAAFFVKANDSTLYSRLTFKQDGVSLPSVGLNSDYYGESNWMIRFNPDRPITVSGIASPGTSEADQVANIYAIMPGNNSFVIDGIGNDKDIMLVPGTIFNLVAGS